MSVAIALLCWNQANFVGEALESIAKQTTKDFNLVVIDNGSVDGSQAAILASVERLELDAKLIFNSHNLGISAALNLALESTQEQYFVPFAADDIMLPNRLTHQLSTFSQLPDRVAVLGSACQIFYDDGTFGDRLYTKNMSSIKKMRRALLRGSTPPAPGVMIRTDALRLLGGYDKECPFEDYDTWIRIVFDLGLEIHADPSVVTLYRRHANNISNNSQVMADGVAYSLARLNKTNLSVTERRALRATHRKRASLPHHFGLLKAALSSGDAKQARKIAQRALIERQLTFGQRVKVSLVLFFPKFAERRVNQRSY